MKSVVLMVLLAVGTLTVAASPTSAAQGKCSDALAWPSFAEVAKTARSIILVKVTRSADGIAEKSDLVEVMRGQSGDRVDLRRLRPGRTKDGCPEPVGPHAQVGDRLLIAYDGTARGRVGSIDAVAHVGRMRDRRNLSGLERLTFEEARAYDAPRTRRRAPKATPTQTPVLWSPRPSLVPAVGRDTDVLWSCRGDLPGFPRSVLSGPTGTEKVEGAVFDGLRRALEAMRSEFEFEPREDRPHRLPWLLAYEDEDMALFLVRRAGNKERYSAMYVEREGDMWGFGGYTEDCQPRPHRGVWRGRHHHHGPSAPGGRDGRHVPRQPLDAIRAGARRAHLGSTAPRWWLLAPRAALAATVARVGRVSSPPACTLIVRRVSTRSAWERCAARAAPRERCGRAERCGRVTR